MDLAITILIWALQAYFWLIIVTVVVSWLVVFDVLNMRNKWVRRLGELLNAATNPLVRPLRKIMPPLGGIDLTPMIIIFGLYFLMSMLEKFRLSLLVG